MKKLILTLALLTATASAQVYNINTERVYDSIPKQWNGWNGYETRTHAHFADGWRPVAEMPHCPDDKLIANVQWSVVDGVAVATWDCQPIPPPPQRLLTLAELYRNTLRQLFGADAEVNRNVTRAFVEDEMLILFSDPETLQQALVAERILDRGFETITEYTGSNETWSFFDKYNHLIDGGNE